MKYEKFVVSYARGTSGNFITQILDRLILGYKPMVYGTNNNCHADQPFTGIPYSNAWNDPKIYEYFEFQDDAVRDFKFAKILTTHTYPDFDTINKRHTSIGIILIIPDLDDFKETVLNQELKVFNRVPKFVHFSQHIANYPEHFTKKVNYPENCLEIKYKEIFTETDSSFVALKKIEEFTGLIAPPELIKDYALYANNQKKLLSQYIDQLR